MTKAIVSDSCEYQGDALKGAREAFCDRYIPFLENIRNDARLQASCRHCNMSYRLTPTQPEIENTFDLLLRDAYDMGMIISNYREVVENLERNPNNHCPTEEYAKSLSKDELLSVITYHFRADHFNNGCLIRHSIAEGYLLLLLKAFASKCVNEVK